MGKRIACYVCLIVCLIRPVSAQEKGKMAYRTFEDLMEELAENSEEAPDYTSLYEDLFEYYQNPLNINEAEQDDIEKLQFLNELQINNLVDYRNRYGKIYSVYEIPLIEGFSREDAIRLMPFITFQSTKQKEAFELKRALQWGKHTFFLRTQTVIEKQKGYTGDTSRSHYLGNSYRHYFRYKFQHKNRIKFGVTAEKDPGEEFFTGTQKNGFDYYSAHLQLTDLGRVKNLVIGDYELQFGQGLTARSGMGMGKTAFAMNISKKRQGLRKYSSTNENQFMRGAGITVALGNFELSAFYSNKKIDANIAKYDTISQRIEEVSSLQNTGIHATASQVEDKDAVKEQIYGANVIFRQNRYKLGLTFLQQKLGSSRQLEKKPYNRFDFQGTKSYNAGLDYQFNYQNLHAFGEFAINDRHALAMLNGVMLSPVEQVSMCVLHRYYSKEYYAYFGNAFGENSKTSNEHGLYFGMEIHPYPNWKISAYFDSFRFQWLKYRVNAPSEGAEYFVQAEYFPTRKFSMYCRFKRERKQENMSENEDTDREKITFPVDKTKQTLRYHLAYQLSKTFEIRNRVEFSFYEKEQKIENGFLIYQDIIFEPHRVPITASIRYALFDTDGYSSRIYAYESDVLYGFSVPAYYERGVRWYGVIKYEMNRHFTCWLRLAQTSYRNKTTVGSGLNEIDGNTKTDVKFQIRITL